MAPIDGPMGGVTQPLNMSAPANAAKTPMLLRMHRSFFSIRRRRSSHHSDPDRNPRKATPESKKTNSMFRGGTLLLTLRSFLSANAIRAEDALDGIDWCSTNNSTPCAVQSITVPVLFTAMGGHFFVRDNEVHYELAASKDKDFVVIEGAKHGISPCKECETTPGQYGNSVKNFFDYLAKWMKARW